MLCTNCKNSQSHNNILIFEGKNKEGICKYCIEAIELKSIEFKVLKNIIEDENVKKLKKCTFCRNKDIQFIDNICDYHTCCRNCFNDPDKFIKNYNVDLKKCKSWVKIGMTNCKSCIKEIDVPDRYYIYTCNLHFYCINCILSNKIYCLYCKGSKDPKEYYENISNKNESLNVLIHDNHSYKYKIFYASDLDRLLNCERCKRIIKIVRESLKIKNLKTYSDTECGYSEIRAESIDLSYNYDCYSQQITDSDMISSSQSQGSHYNINPNIYCGNNSNPAFQSNIYSYYNQNLLYQDQPHLRNISNYTNNEAALYQNLEPLKFEMDLQNENTKLGLAPIYIKNQPHTQPLFLQNYEVQSILNSNDQSYKKNSKGMLCITHKNSILNLLCKHQICRDCVYERFMEDLNEFCYHFLNKSLFHDPRKFRIRCPIENCHSGYLYSCDVFQEGIEKIFNHYKIHQNYWEFIKIYFEGSYYALHILLAS